MSCDESMGRGVVGFWLEECAFNGNRESEATRVGDAILLKWCRHMLEMVIVQILFDLHFDIFFKLGRQNENSKYIINQFNMQGYLSYYV